MNKEIIIWHELDGFGDSSLKMIESICKEMYDQYDISIRLVKMNITEFLEKLENLDSIEEKPDVALIAQDMVGIGIKDLSTVPDEYAKYMDKAVWDSMKLDGVQKGLPYLQGNHAIVYYNKEYYNNKPKVWDDLFKVNDKKVIPFSVDLNVGYWALPFLYTFSKGNNEGKLITEEGEEKTIKFISNMCKNKKMISTTAISDMLTKFKNGEIASILNGEWYYKYLVEVMGDKLGICVIPEIDGEQVVGASSSIGMAFPNNSLYGEKKEEMSKFLNYMLSKDVQYRWYKEYYRLPVNKEVLSELRVQKDEVSDIYKQMTQNTRIINEECTVEFWSYCQGIFDKCKEK